jgi:hypothetical protein
MAIPTQITWNVEHLGSTAKLNIASKSKVGFGLFVFFSAAAIVFGVFLRATGSGPGSYFFIYGFLALLGIPVALTIRRLNAIATGSVELDPARCVLRRTEGLRMMAKESITIPTPGTLVLEHYVHLARASGHNLNSAGSTRARSLRRDYFRLSVIPERIEPSEDVALVIAKRRIATHAPISRHKTPLADGAELIIEGHDEKVVRAVGRFLCEELDRRILDASLDTPRLLEPGDGLLEPGSRT